MQLISGWMSNRFLRYAILDAGTLVLSGRLFVIFVSGELTFVSGAFCTFYFKIWKDRKTVFFFCHSQLMKMNHWIKNFLFEVGWGSFLMSIIDVNRSLMGFWCHVYFPDMLNLMTQTSGKQLKRNISCSCDCEEWNLICDWVLIKVLKRTFYKMFDIVGKNVCLEIL